MSNSIICNIPHSGMYIPEWAKQDFIISELQLKQFSEKMVDKDIDKIFSFISSENKIVQEISRVVVDMERYRNDKDEPMSKLGMGLFYEKDDLGNIIRIRRETYTKCLKIYDDYHAKLTNLVDEKLNIYDKCYILDCHSFHNGLTYTGYNTKNFPDVCIGFNEEHPNKEILYIKKLFEKYGYIVALNMPFSGALVPLKHLNNPKVYSIMLELNRQVYNNDKKFYRVQNICKEIVEYLENEK